MRNIENTSYDLRFNGSALMQTRRFAGFFQADGQAYGENSVGRERAFA